jgi:hypothetical protein
MRRAAAVLALVLPLLAPIASAQPAVPGLPEAIPAGSAPFSFLGFRVYQARLWVAPGFRRSTLGDAALALELAYERNFTGAAIARRSLEEIERAGRLDADQAQRWESGLRALLPDVKPGDRLLGVHRPGRGVEFYQDGRVLGRIDDPEFSRRFFAIWLGPATSAPGLRDALLAGTAP